jgi:hypothetical protein
MGAPRSTDIMMPASPGAHALQEAERVPAVPTHILSMAFRFFTIGHSTRSVAELAGLLQQAGAGLLVDVRAIPRSRTNPQFNADALPESLAPWQIGYRHIRSLGGLREHPKDQGPSPNAYWENRSFRNYADYTATEPFRAGLAELRDLGRTHVLRHHMRRGGMVALPPAVHRQLSHVRGRAGVPHHGRGQDRAGRPDPGCRPATRWHAGLYRDQMALAAEAARPRRTPMPLDRSLELIPRHMLQHGVKYAVVVRHGLDLPMSGDIAKRRTRAESMPCTKPSENPAGQPWNKPGHDEQSLISNWVTTHDGCHFQPGARPRRATPFQPGRSSRCVRRCGDRRRSARRSRCCGTSALAGRPGPCA